MLFAKILDGVVVEYKHFDSQPECKIIGGLPTVRPVISLSKPVYDPMTQDLQRVDTIFADRVEWSWNIVSLPAEQITANQQAADDAAVKLSVKMETQVHNFIAMTPAQVNTYIENNVTDLASAKTILKFFGRMLLILVRREYR